MIKPLPGNGNHMLDCINRDAERYREESALYFDDEITPDSVKRKTQYAGYSKGPQARDHARG